MLNTFIIEFELRFHFTAEVDEAARSVCLPKRKLDPEYDRQRPLPEYFMEYLPEYLIDNPHDLKCPQAGHPIYATSVNISQIGDVIQ